MHHARYLWPNITDCQRTHAPCDEEKYANSADAADEDVSREETDEVAELEDPQQKESETRKK